MKSTTKYVLLFLGILSPGALAQAHQELIITGKPMPGIWIGGTDFDHPCEVLATGPEFVFVNGGMRSRGVLVSPTRVEATEWPNAATGAPPPLGATIADGGNTIVWDNRTTWRRLKTSGGQSPGAGDLGPHGRIVRD